MSKWIVVNIGCIECGVSSDIVGVFDREDLADAVAGRMEHEFSWREGGQNSFQVFPMPETNVINPKYEPKP